MVELAFQLKNLKKVLFFDQYLKRKLFQMNLTVLTPDKTIFQGAINSIKVPGVLGEFQVLNNHAPLVSALESGKVTIITEGAEVKYFDESQGDITTGHLDGNRYFFKIEKGFIEVLNGDISLLVQGVDHNISA